MEGANGIVSAMNLNTVVADFANQLSTLIEKEATERAQAAVLAAFGTPQRRGPGRPPNSTALTLQTGPALAAVKKARRKGPIQLCPVPGCKNPAAPIFGMVCAKHKGLPKAKIKKFREARKAKKLGLRPLKAVKAARQEGAPSDDDSAEGPRDGITWTRGSRSS
jgi:hypothetical protein